MTGRPSLPRHARRLAAALAILTPAVASAQPDPTPPAPRVMPTVIALLPIQLPDSLPEPERVRATFDSLLTALLTGAGYRVVGSEVTAPAWKQVVDSMGGYYDRRTGRIVHERYLAAASATVARLRAEHGTDALLAPGVIVTMAPTDKGTATWDGVSERVANAGWSSVPVLTLVALSADAAGAVLHCGRGGLHSVVAYSQWWGTTKARPDAKFLADAERNAAAARRALAPLLARAPACESTP